MKEHSFKKTGIKKFKVREFGAYECIYHSSDKIIYNLLLCTLGIICFIFDILSNCINVGGILVWK